MVVHSCRARGSAQRDGRILDTLPTEKQLWPKPNACAKLIPED